MHWNEMRVSDQGIFWSIGIEYVEWAYLNQNAICVLCPQNVYQGNEWYIMSSNGT